MLALPLHPCYNGRVSSNRCGQWLLPFEGVVLKSFRKSFLFYAFLTAYSGCYLGKQLDEIFKPPP